jgi:DNA-binding protein H-NS
MLRKAESPGVKQLRMVLIKYRLTPADISHAFADSSKGRRNPLKGQKVKPKYRNPAKRGETWSGRGLRPKWLVAAMKGGKKLEDFAI